MYELVNVLQNLITQLNTSVKALRSTGTELAVAEQNYKIKMHEVILIMREKGTPATLINQLIHGDKEVAKLRFKRDVARTIYEANQESINALKVQIRVTENQLSREWTNG